MIGQVNAGPILEGVITKHADDLFATDDPLVNRLQERFCNLDFNKINGAFGMKGDRAVVNLCEEIVTKLGLENKKIDDEDLKSVAHRLFIVQAMIDLNSESSNVGYDHDRADFSMNSDWEPITAVDAYDTKDSAPPSKEGRAYAFRLGNFKNFETAIENLVSNDQGAEHSTIDCSIGMQIAHLKALLDLEISPSVLGERFGYELTLLPDNLTTEDGDGASLTKLLSTRTISSVGDLIPGDSVYFKNYSNYQALNEKYNGSKGAWEGEHAMYFGNNRYSGFGVDAATYDEMLDALKSEYRDLESKVRDDQKLRGAAMKKTYIEENLGADTIGNTLPGLSIEVSAINPEDLRTLL